MDVFFGDLICRRLNIALNSSSLSHTLHDQIMRYMQRSMRTIIYLHQHPFFNRTIEQMVVVSSEYLVYFTYTANYLHKLTSHCVDYPRETIFESSFDCYMKCCLSSRMMNGLVPINVPISYMSPNIRNLKHNLANQSEICHKQCSKPDCNSIMFNTYYMEMWTMPHIMLHLKYSTYITHLFETEVLQLLIPDCQRIPGQMNISSRNIPLSEYVILLFGICGFWFGFCSTDIGRLIRNSSRLHRRVSRRKTIKLVKLLAFIACVLHIYDDRLF